MSKDPARDCPPCPACHLPLGTPILVTGVERWDGPPEADLWCPSCGHGWVGIMEDVAQAVAAWRAYEQELRDRVADDDIRKDSR